MSFDSFRHHRRSVRLPAFDYASEGLYFVTACTYGRQHLFGMVVDGEMCLSAFGQIAETEWRRTAEVRPYVVLDAFVVMPDHVHLLFGIVPHDGNARVDSPTRRGTPAVCPYPRDGAMPDGTRRRFAHAVAHSVPSIMRQFKSVVTKRIRALDPTVRVWQRSFHDRVVHTEREADAIRRYIAENPARWDPEAIRPDGHRV